MRVLAIAVLLLTSAPVRSQEQKPILDPAAAGPAQRIWSEAVQPEQELWLRRRLALPEATRTQAARIVVSCDNQCTILVNGKLIATASNWEKLTIIDLEDDVIHAGDNAIAVHAKNSGGPAALVLWLTWTDATGEAHELVTDRSWRVADAAHLGWETAKFDDTDWRAATELGPTPFAGTVYGNPPRALVFVNVFTEAAVAIEQALQTMRSARDTQVALRSLEIIERAVMEARRRIWERQNPKDGEKR